MRSETHSCRREKKGWTKSEKKTSVGHGRFCVQNLSSELSWDVVWNFVSHGWSVAEQEDFRVQNFNHLLARIAANRIKRDGRKERKRWVWVMADFLSRTRWVVLRSRTKLGLSWMKHGRSITASVVLETHWSHPSEMWICPATELPLTSWLLFWPMPSCPGDWLLLHLL